MLIDTLVPRVLIIGQEMGPFYRSPYFENPQSVHSHSYPLLGQTVKLVGKGSTLLAYDPQNIV